MVDKKFFYLFFIFVLFFAFVTSVIFISQIHVSSISDFPEIEFGNKSMYSALSSIPNWNDTFSPSNVGKISKTDISNILWAGQGENRPGRRVVPSAGATYPLDLYIAFYNTIVNTEGLIGKYNPEAHSLTKIDSIIHSKDLMELNGYDGDVFIIITSTDMRTSLRYGDRARQYINLEIGHVLENIRLEAWSRDLLLKTYIINGKLVLSKIAESIKIEVIIGLQKGGLIQPSNDKITYLTSKLLKSEQTISVEQVIQSRISVRDYMHRNISSDEFQSFAYLSLNSLAESYSSTKSLLGNNLSYVKQSTKVKFATGIQINNLKPGIYV